jgi:four helix bundle protein
VKNDNREFKRDFKKRMYYWTLSMIKLIDTLPKDTSTQIMANQLFRSGTSIGANYIEAQAGSSRKDFTNFIHHSLKSANESKFWLALLRDTKKSDPDAIKKILAELIELSNILASSLLTLKNKK